MGPSTTISATAPATFPRFSSLPPELRHQIWTYNLPDQDRPALFPYRKGCWRRLPPEKCYIRAMDWPEFHGKLLEPVPVETPPIYFVNRDARGVVLSWAHRKAIGIYFCKEKRKHVFGPRVFDDEKDTLCVELDSYPDFCSEPSRRPSDPDFPELKYPPGSGPSLRRIAIPKHLFTFAVNSGSGMLVHHMLREIFEWFPSIEEIIIIVNAHGCMKAHQRWELGNAHGKAFIYDQKRRLYSWDDGESICDEAIYKLIEKATEGLSQALSERHAITLRSIRPAFAVEI